MESGAFRVIDLNFPHMLAESAVEPEDGSGGLVWNGLNARPFADGAPFRQVRRSGRIAHLSSVGRAQAVRNAVSLKGDLGDQLLIAKR